MIATCYLQFQQQFAPHTSHKEAIKRKRYSTLICGLLVKSMMLALEPIQ